MQKNFHNQHYIKHTNTMRHLNVINIREKNGSLISQISAKKNVKSILKTVIKVNEKKILGIFFVRKILLEAF